MLTHTNTNVRTCSKAYQFHFKAACRRGDLHLKLLMKDTYRQLCLTQECIHCAVCLITWHLVHRHVHRQDGSLCGLICTYIHDTYMTHTHVYMDTTQHTHKTDTCKGTLCGYYTKHTNTHTPNTVSDRTHTTHLAISISVSWLIRFVH